jgi:hypothetical protein
VTTGLAAGFGQAHLDCSNESPMTKHTMSLRTPGVLLAFVPTLLVFGVGCSSGTALDARLASERDVTLAVVPGLEQHVTVTPAELVVGENVAIHSVITNRGSTPVNLESRICGLDLGGDLQLTAPPDVGTCLGYSLNGLMAPGDSRESGEIRRVASPPGNHTLRVRHALRPEAWVEFRVVVRAR